MTRTCGWAARGSRLVAHGPHGHWKALTLLAGLRHDRIMAPFVLDGPINGDSFTAWVSQSLVPTLAPGNIVIADNLGSHKGQPARQLSRKAGAHLLFLPPYSPDLDPINLRRENGPPDRFLILLIFAKLKTIRWENDSLDRFLILLIPQSLRAHRRRVMATRTIETSWRRVMATRHGDAWLALEAGLLLGTWAQICGAES